MPSLADQPELLNSVLERMAKGEVITAICREIGYSPGAIWMVADRDEAFRERYLRARQQQAHAIAADVVRIVDEEDRPSHTGIARNRSEARKWLAARIDPANYGDKPAQVNVNISLRDMIRQSTTIEHEPAADAAPQQITGPQKT